MPEGSKEELLAKLQSYQKFMADYIVKAQEQKLAAVRAAEAATAKKYEEKLLLLGGAAAAPSISKRGSRMSWRTCRLALLRQLRWPGSRSGCRARS